MSKKLTSGNDALQTNQNPLEKLVENKDITYYCCIPIKYFNYLV